MIINIDDKIKKLKSFAANKDEILFAFIFGSFAHGRNMIESDFDFAIYLKSDTNRVQVEEDVRFSIEDKIWLEIEDIIKIDTDLIVLNRCPAELADDILRTGTPLIIKDQGLYLEYLLRVSAIAEDFRRLVFDYYKVKQRSASLNDIDKLKLIKRLDFMKKEFEEYSQFINLSFEMYNNNSAERRNVERWIENIINAYIDIAKILLASEKKSIPETYKQTLQNLALLEGFNKDVADKIEKYSKLRNILAHEYLDITFVQIKEFINNSEESIKYLIEFVEKKLI